MHDLEGTDGRELPLNNQFFSRNFSPLKSLPKFEQPKHGAERATNQAKPFQNLLGRLDFLVFKEALRLLPNSLNQFNAELKTLLIHVSANEHLYRSRATVKSFIRNLAKLREPEKCLRQVGNVHPMSGERWPVIPHNH